MPPWSVDQRLISSVSMQAQLVVHGKLAILFSEWQWYCLPQNWVKRKKTENRMHLLQIAKEHFRGGLKSEQARNDR